MGARSRDQQDMVNGTRLTSFGQESMRPLSTPRPIRPTMFPRVLSQAAQFQRFFDCPDLGAPSMNLEVATRLTFLEHSYSYHPLRSGRRIHVRAICRQPRSRLLANGPLPRETLQAIASEFNLSETAFVRAVNDGFELRWFTPRDEVALCGHATLATAYALQRTFGTALPNYRFQTLSGEHIIAPEGDLLELNFPRPRLLRRLSTLLS